MQTMSNSQFQYLKNKLMTPKETEHEYESIHVLQMAADRFARSSSYKVAEW